MSNLKSAMQQTLFTKIGLAVNNDLNSLLDFFNDELDALGVKGNVAEIGVARGAFLIPLALCCKDDEVAIAIDVFEDIRLNWNVYGGMSTVEIIRKNAELAGVGPLLRLISGDSLHVDHAQILAAGGAKKIKLFSVDGSHSVHHTVNDLELAGNVLAPGGIVFIDDIRNWGWPGAIEGFARYSLLQPSPRLVPFLLLGNKFLLTTACHQPHLLKAAVKYAELLGRLPEKTYRVSRFFGWDVAGWN